MLRTQKLDKFNFHLSDAWASILASVAYAVRSTYHTTLGATPAQLVFQRDMIYPLAYVAEWDVIEKNKQRLIDKNNSRENATRVDYDYHVGDKILVINTDIQRKLDNPNKGPFTIKRVCSNGTVVILRNNNVTERINIRRIKPFFEPQLAGTT